MCDFCSEVFGKKEDPDFKRGCAQDCWNNPYILACFKRYNEQYRIVTKLNDKSKPENCLTTVDVMNSSADLVDAHEDTRFSTLEEAFESSICFPPNANRKIVNFRRIIWENCQSSHDFREKNEAHEKMFENIFNAKENDVLQLYLMFMDFVIWINKLYDSEFVQKKDYNDFNLMCNTCIDAFCATVDKFDEKEMEKATEELCTIRPLDRFLYCICRSKWYRLYTLAFNFSAFNDAFNRYLGALKTFYKRGKDSLRWIIEMKFFSNHHPERLITLALIENMLPNLLPHYEEKKKDMKVKFELEQMVLFLDRALVSARNRRCYLRPNFDVGFDKMSTDCAERLLQTVRESTLTRTVFLLRKMFDLPDEYCKFSTFVRHLTAFFTAVRDYRISSAKAENEEEGEFAFDIFQQRVHHHFKDNYYMRYAGLVYIMDESVSEALFFAYYNDIPRSDWPLKLKRAETEEKRNKILPLIDEYDRRIFTECESVKNGFTIDNGHKVLLVDSEERLSLLNQFCLKSKEIGFDAEWDQSYSAEMGVLGLIQLSSKAQTMLVDIEAFRRAKFSKERWQGLFKTIFGGQKRIFGFAYESDLKTIVHNFPCIEEIINDCMGNLVCLRNAMIAISSNRTAVDAIFNGVVPERQNLQSLSVDLLGWKMEKMEQASVWTERPLRKRQLVYAAKDSLACLLIGQLFKEKLEGIVDDVDELFPPLRVIFNPEKVKESRIEGIKKYDALLAENKTQSGKKTKSNHFTKKELVDLVETINADLKSRFPAEEFIKPDGLRLCADPMCTQVSLLLRRCGISVMTEETDKNYMRVHADPTVKVLTTGKLVAKYPPAQVIDLPASVATLDKQLATFLETQKVVIDTKKMVPRCCKCNARDLLFVPTPVMRYLHCAYAIANAHKMTHCSYSTEDLSEYKTQCKAMQPRSKIGIGMCIFGGKTTVYMGQNGMIDMKRLGITKTERGRPINPIQSSANSLGAPTKAVYVLISLAVHLNLKELEIPAGTFHAICTHCGKENVEAVIHAGNY
uniref:3'-5' exonuclease domain-containing protein n=1 Tax=Bursaphelenchus xylophilus TaxID=6326 RepID=A0A1I7SFH4_BURXY